MTHSKIRKLDLGNALVILSGGKIVLSPKGSTKHLTLQPGAQSRILDIHLTERTKDGDRHETLFKIGHAELERAFLEMKDELTSALFDAVKLFDPKKMVRKPIYAVTGLIPTGDDARRLLKVYGRRVRIDQKRLKRQISLPIAVSKILEIPDGEGYVLVSRRRGDRWRRLGSGVIFSDSMRKRRAAWLPDRLRSQAWERFEEILRKHLERYSSNVAEFDHAVAR